MDRVLINYVSQSPAPLNCDKYIREGTEAVRMRFDLFRNVVVDFYC